MRKLIVFVDHSRCVGNASCLSIAPNVFAHNEERQSVVINPTGDPNGVILEAADTSPVSAITVRDAETGEELYP